MSTNLRTYRRKFPLYVRARPLEFGEVVYDPNGKVLDGWEVGDMLIELSTDRFVMSQALFGQLYEELVEASTNGQTA